MARKKREAVCSAVAKALRKAGYDVSELRCRERVVSVPGRTETDFFALTEVRGRVSRRVRRVRHADE